MVILDFVLGFLRFALFGIGRQLEMANWGGK
jgi:hypothetical protein